MFLDQPQSDDGPPDKNTPLKAPIALRKLKIWRRKKFRRRYRMVKRFFFRVLIQTLWWDGLFGLPLLRWFQPAAHIRWQQIAKRYKELAQEKGGLLIKFGQFLSTRVDLFPTEVTRELAGLQDSVEPVPAEDIMDVIEADFHRPIKLMFSKFVEDPVGSASLAQAHEVVLLSGETAIVKVLRPLTFRIVETDLRAIGALCEWLKVFKKVRQSVDLNRLLEEFSDTTLKELDMIKEKENIKEFIKDFKDDPQIYVPRIYEDYCSPKVLTLENVGYIKIADIAAMGACGIQNKQVADRLYDIYMHQIFVTNFVHVDPHPGNLFIKPMPVAEEIEKGIIAFAPGEPVPYKRNRPFQIVFIDFGMMAEVSERLKAAMRMYAMGLGTQDARKIVQSYIMAGTLQPGADLRQLEEMHQEWLQKVWGLRLHKIQETAFREVRYLMREYRDLILETPFQVQADMLFIGRAVAILAGLTSLIDPKFDPWSKTLAYAKRFAKEEIAQEWQGFWDEILLLGKNIRSIPELFEQVLTRAKQGALVVQVSLSPQTRRAIGRIDQSVRRFAWMVAAAGLLISGVNLHIAGHGTPYGTTLLGLSFLAFLWGLRKT